MKNKRPTITFKSKNDNNSRSSPNRQEVVTKLAYQFYVEGGRQNGHDQDDWLKAEVTVR